MSNKISRRAFLKCAGVSAAAVGSASLLSGCKTNGSNTTVNDVKVGDTVKNWNGLGVQLSSVFRLTQDPAQPGYEYLGVRVTVLNRSKTDSYTIGAQGVDAINAALASGDTNPISRGKECTYTVIASGLPKVTVNTENPEDTECPIASLRIIYTPDTEYNEYTANWIISPDTAVPALG